MASFDSDRYLRDFARTHPDFNLPTYEHDDVAITGEDFTRNPAMRVKMGLVEYKHVPKKGEIMVNLDDDDRAATHAAVKQERVAVKQEKGQSGSFDSISVMYDKSLADAQAQKYANDEEALRSVLELSQAEADNPMAVEEPVAVVPKVPYIPVVVVPDGSDSSSESSDSDDSIVNAAGRSTVAMKAPRKLPVTVPIPTSEIEAPFLTGGVRLFADTWIHIARYVPIEDKYRLGQVCRFLMLLVLSEDPDVEFDTNTIVQLQTAKMKESPFLAFTVEQLDFVRVNSMLLDLGKKSDYNCGLMPPYYFSLFYAAQCRLNNAVMTSIQVQKHLNMIKNKKNAGSPARADLEQQLHATMNRADMVAGPMRFLLQIYGSEVVKLMNEINNNTKNEPMRVAGLDSWRWVGAQAWLAVENSHPRIVAKCTNGNKFKPYLESQAQRKRFKNSAPADAVRAREEEEVTAPPAKKAKKNDGTDTQSTKHHKHVHHHHHKRQEVAKTPGGVKPQQHRRKKHRGRMVMLKDLKPQAKVIVASSSSESEDETSGANKRALPPKETTTLQSAAPPPPYQSLV